MFKSQFKKIILSALQEDAAFHDITTRTLIPEKLRTKAIFLAKENFVLCGMPIVQEVFKILDPKLRFKIYFKEGAKIRKGQKIAEVSGKARAILFGERVALNFLQHLSGISTLTHQFVQKVKGTKAKILDTRKTIPGLRLLEKYAVKVGGGMNHRFDLKSAVMVKDNHLMLSGKIEEVWKRLQPLAKKIPVILEVKNFSELKKAVALGVLYLQLDNMTVSQLKQAVQMVRGRARNKILPKLEATGGVNLGNVRAIAKTGVDFISVGAITHSARAVDIGLETLYK